MPRVSRSDRQPLESDENEYWTDIVGYEGLYQVSTLGRVRRLGTIVTETTADGVIVSIKQHEPYIVKQTVHRYGYKVCGLRSNNMTTSIRVHRAVADAFLPHDTIETEVHHRDHNSLNNGLSNLEWLTPEAHAERHKTKHRRTYLT